MAVERLHPRPALISAGLLVLTPVLGIAVRFSHSGLPWAVRKYGGSVLWAAMIYWVISTVLQRSQPLIAALCAEVVAVTVEYFKLVHTRAVDAFRGTLAGVLLLGREFAYADILAYTVAIACVALIDAWIRTRPQNKEADRA